MSPTSSTISSTQRLMKSSSRSNPATRCPRTCMTRKTIGRALSSPLFIQEREEPADCRQAYRSFEESLLPSQSLSVCHVRTGRPVHELSSLGSSSREKPSRNSENEQIRILLERQLRRDQQLLHEQLLEQNRDLREAHMKSLNEMEELKRFQGSTFDECSRRRLIEDRDTFLELTAKIQELQNEVSCMSDSRDFEDAESVRSGQSHVTSQPAFSHLFPPFPDPGGMLSRSLARMVFRETFLQMCHYKSNGVFFSTLSARDQPLEL